MVITRDGQTESHSFDSVEDLRQRNPELYERIRDWLGELDKQERTRSPRRACPSLA